MVRALTVLHTSACENFAKMGKCPTYVADRSRYDEGYVILHEWELEDDDIPNILYGALPQLGIYPFKEQS